MKPEEKEKAQTTKSGQSRDPILPPNSSNQPPPDFVPTPVQLPRVTAVRGSMSEPDILATQMFLDAYQTKQGFQCPRCPYLTTDADDFIFHLSEEINKGIASLADLT